MATTLSTMYPPQVETFMPSFCYNDSAKVWFNISSYDEDMLNSIQYLHVSMVDQRNNTNVFAGTQGSGANATTVYPQYYPVKFYPSKTSNNTSSTTKRTGYDPDKKMYWVLISPQVLKTSPYYNIGQYYKVQLRFDLTGSSEFSANNGYTNPTNYFKWTGGTTVTANALQLASYTNSNEDNFSEWSTGTLLKPILIPELALQNFNTASRAEVNPSTDVPVAGQINFNKASGDGVTVKTETEYLSWYQIKILNNAKTLIYHDSDKINPITQNQVNYKVDMSMLTVNTNYQMRFIYETNNGYTATIDYPIKTANYSSSTNITYSKSIDEEEGIITLDLFGLNSYAAGYVVVRRTSHRSNFTKWDLIAAYSTPLSSSNLVIVDNTVESMTGYRYQLQYIKADGTMYAPQYIESDDILHCDFYGGIFSDSDRTLRVTFNFQPSSRANAVNRTKTDTLGGQYPIFTQNAKLKYHTYTINGLISTEDNGELFLPKQTVFGLEYYNYRYNDNSITDTSAVGGSSGVTTIDEQPVERIQSDNDWLYEREYRDAVEEWLNNGKPKLFRSMTEGNMIVMLDGVSMTPKQELGRRLYDFNATMYEIGDGKDINSIASFGLFEIVDERQ